MEKFNIGFIVLGLVFPYILIKFLLLKKFKIFEKKISMVTNVRWGNSNKSHLGGIVFFFNFCLGFGLYLYSNDGLNLNNIDPEKKKIIALFFSICLGFLAGLLDEIEVLPPFTKILTQFFASLFFIFGNIIIPITGIYLIDVVFTSLFFIFIINVVNIFDNIDLGLAAPISIIFLFFYLINDYSFVNFYNYILVLILMNLLIASLVIPLFIYDFIFVFFRRILKKKNPFRGDADHLSHNLYKKFKNANIVSFIFVLIQTCSILLAIYIINDFDSTLNEILKIFTFHLVATTSLYLLLKKISSS